MASCRTESGGIAKAIDRHTEVVPKRSGKTGERSERLATTVITETGP